MEGKYTGVRYVHGAGKVMGKVWYTETARVQLKEEKIEKTGATEKKYRINFNNFQINLYKTLSKFEKYDTIYTDKKVKIFSDFYLPVSFTECDNFETISKTRRIHSRRSKKYCNRKGQRKN